MSSADLVILNGRVATSSRLRRCAVAAKGGRITWIGSNSNAPKATRVIDASGLIVLPGVIDVHVHMREPGATHKEDFQSGTAAAAAGGVTTIFDMPNTTPPTQDVDSLRLKVRAASKKALVDYALYGLLARDNRSDIAPLVRAGVVGFKCYLTETTGVEGPPPDGELLREMALAGQARRRVSFHAEDDETVRRRLLELKAAGRVDPIAHYESRPAAAEERGVRRAVALARRAKCDLHIAHLSSAAGASVIQEEKRRRPGSRVTAETCPQYLLLDSTDYAREGSMMKVNPSIKRREDRHALWRAVRDGTIDMLATDHAPHTLEEKTSGSSIFEQPSGFPGLETSVALMLTCVNKGLLSLSRYVQLTSENPAKSWGLYPKKGVVAVGADADFTVVDTRVEWRIDPEKFVSKAKYSPFAGFQAKGKAAYTVVRGRVVMDKGEIGHASVGEMQRPLAMARMRSGTRRS